METHRKEILIAIILTISAFLHWYIYIALLFLALIILPSFKLGDTNQFLFDGAIIKYSSLMTWMLPIIFIIATVEYYYIDDDLIEVCLQNSFCDMSTSLLLNILSCFTLNFTFAYTMRRANYTYRPFRISNFFFFFIPSFYFPLFYKASFSIEVTDYLSQLFSFFLLSWMLPGLMGMLFCSLGFVFSFWRR